MNRSTMRAWPLAIGMLLAAAPAVAIPTARQRPHAMAKVHKLLTKGTHTVGQLVEATGYHPRTVERALQDLDKVLSIETTGTGSAREYIARQKEISHSAAEKMLAVPQTVLRSKEGGRAATDVAKAATALENKAEVKAKADGLREAMEGGHLPELASALGARVDKYVKGPGTRRASARDLVGWAANEIAESTTSLESAPTLSKMLYSGKNKHINRLAIRISREFHRNARKSPERWGVLGLIEAAVAKEAPGWTVSLDYKTVAKAATAGDIHPDFARRTFDRFPELTASGGAHPDEITPAPFNEFLEEEMLPATIAKDAK